MTSMPWAELVQEYGDDSGSSNGSDPIPEGEYEFAISSAESRFASTGKKMFVVTADVQEGPYKDRRVWHNFVISRDSRKAMEFFFRNMRSLGISNEFFTSNPSDDSVVDNLIGRHFRGLVGKRFYNDRERNEIRRFSESRMSGSLSTKSSREEGPPDVGPSKLVDDGVPDLPPF